MMAMRLCVWSHRQRHSTQQLARSLINHPFSLYPYLYLPYVYIADRDSMQIAVLLVLAARST